MVQSGGFLDDIMEYLLYPTSKWEAIKQGVVTLLFYPIIFGLVVPFAYFVSFWIGLFNAHPDRICDCCKKLKPHTVGSSHKFFWFCEDCLKKYHKLIDKFMKGK